MSSTPIYLLKDRRPDSCFVDQIYDPDRDGLPSDTMAVVIPNVGALAIDRENGNSLYVVSAVNSTTYKSTLQPVRLIQSEENSENIEILSYGNDKFMLYFDDRTKPTKLIVDGKLRVFGSALKEYRLVHELADGTEEVISLYVNTNETYSGDRIPMVPVATGSNLKQCTNCHTLHTLSEGDVVRLEIFDTIGILSVSVKLILKRSTILNDLSGSTDIITAFTATANQMDGDNFYIYQRQSPETLVISPRLVYNDGTAEDITIDKISCFVYGLDDFIPAYPGQRQKILIKKYLGRNQASPLSEFDGKSRFVSLEKWVTVRGNNSLAGIKISIVPVWSTVQGKYSLKCVAYTDIRDKIYDLTSKVVISGFDGSVFNTTQSVILDVDLKDVFGTSESVTYRQILFLSLKPYSQFQRYTIKDSSTDSYVFGVESSDKRRPVIHYDSTLRQYFVPTSRFKNVAAFLEAYYLMARPPYDTETELEPVTPTHFTIRSVDSLNTIISLPIPIAQYNQLWNIVLSGNPNQLLNSQVIVEFLTFTNSEYQILYGVPVDVYQSTTGYNTDLNN